MTIVFSAALMATVSFANEPILRHAVFFEFKDSASQAAVQNVVDGFDALPSKLDVIEDYVSGVNVNEKPNSDGLTHAFLVGFAGEEQREAYLPAAEHLAFVEILKPQLEHPFVFDFWGTKCPLKSRHLKHAVFVEFKSDADPSAVQDVVDSLLALGDQIDTIRHVEGGVNNSPEPLSDGFSHGFIFSFDDLAGLKVYGPSDAHQSVVAKLKPVMDKVRVIDFFVEPSM